MDQIEYNATIAEARINRVIKLEHFLRGAGLGELRWGVLPENCATVMQVDNDARLSSEHIKAIQEAGLTSCALHHIDGWVTNYDFERPREIPPNESVRGCRIRSEDGVTIISC